MTTSATQLESTSAMEVHNLRRPLRFSLRTMLIVVTSVAVVLALIGISAQRHAEHFAQEVLMSRLSTEELVRDVDANVSNSRPQGSWQGGTSATMSRKEWSLVYFTPISVTELIDGIRNKLKSLVTDAGATNVRSDHIGYAPGTDGFSMSFSFKGADGIVFVRAIRFDTQFGDPRPWPANTELTMQAVLNR